MASIGEEIKQKKFKSEYNKLLINVMYTHSWLNSLQGRIFKQHGITPQQYNSLRILKGQLPEAASVNLLKDRMIDKMSNVSRIIDKLKAKELVTRRTCKADRRQVDVKITQKGLDLLHAISLEMDEWEKQLHNITEDEAHALNELLDKWRG